MFVGKSHITQFAADVESHENDSVRSSVKKYDKPKVKSSTPSKSEHFVFFFEIIIIVR